MAFWSYGGKTLGGRSAPEGAEMVEWSPALGRPALGSQKFPGYILKRLLS